MEDNREDMTLRLGQSFGSPTFPHEIIKRTYESKFFTTDVGSFGSDVHNLFPIVRVSSAIGSSHSKASALGIAERVLPLRKNSNLIVVDPVVTLGTQTHVVIYIDRPPADSRIEILEAAKQRLSNHNDLAEKVYSIIRNEAKRVELSPRIVVRPSWSHEYEDRTGVVVEVEINSDSDTRFKLWDAISSKLDSLIDSIPEEDQSFLTDDLSVFVNQSE